MTTNKPPDPEDFVRAERQALIDAHIIHDFDSALVIRNLVGTYGWLMEKFYAEILDDLRGQRIIDCGCGFGQFSFVARQREMDIISVDIDDASIDIARTLYNLNCRKESIYRTSLPDNSRDVAVFFDSIEHLVLDDLLPELDRLGVRKVVVGDSNEMNPLLRLYRHAVGHEEANEYSIDHLVRQFSSRGFRLKRRRFWNFVSLPLSGGLQRRPVPILGDLRSVIHYLERLLEPLARALALDRYLAFRYVIVLER